MEDIIDVVVQNPQSGAAIYASADTQAKLGWITTKMGEIIPIDTAIISQADIHSLTDIFDPPTVRITPEDRMRSVISEVIDGANIAPDIKQRYLDAANPDIQSNPNMEAIMDSHVHTLLNASQYNIAMAYSLDLDTDGLRDVSFIVTPNLYTTPEELLGGLAQTPAYMLENIPGDTHDYLAIAMFHESAHSAQQDYMLNNGTYQNYVQNPLIFEADADASMVRAFNDAVADGYDLDPAALEAFEAARYAGGLGNYGLIAGQSLSTVLAEQGHFIRPTSHNTANLVDWDNGLPILPKDSPLAEMEASATFQVNYMLGLYNVATQTALALGTDDMNTLTEEQQALVEANIAQLSENPQFAALNGVNYAQLNPGASLAALEGLQEKGYLGEGSEAYVDRVRDFFENHAPDILETGGYTNTQAEFSEFLPAIEDIPSPETPAPQNPQYDSPAIAGNDPPAP